MPSPGRRENAALTGWGNLTVYRSLGKAQMRTLIIEAAYAEIRRPIQFPPQWEKNQGLHCVILSEARLVVSGTDAKITP
jgi:hypothetical protein